MKKLKLPISRLKLTVFSSLLLITSSNIQYLIKYQNLSDYAHAFYRISYLLFFISLTILFFEKKGLAFFILINTLVVLTFYDFESSLLHYSFEFYKKSHPDLFSKCIKEEYHNPEKQILAYCFSTNEPAHTFDRDVMYDSGNELQKQNAERSCEWDDAFKKLAMQNSFSMLHSFAMAENVDVINFNVINLGSSYYEIRYSIDPLYTPLTQKKSCK
ncbi:MULTISPECIES: hypothetical protein [Dickeya]|uniref:Uncharacterized protein n=1 Tax=Dickeya oryzae TaxID=1240404 RepID=A0ABS5BGY0_9GAMM|nr:MULTISPECIES: hypothetical protein [Dickeya]MBP2859710.1 hypothetical protein [Dickeya oryzae]